MVRISSKIRRLLIDEALERDYTVRGCEDPSAALELAGSYKPHLAIVDIRMPGMDGFELMTALQRQDADVITPRRAWYLPAMVACDQRLRRRSTRHESQNRLIYWAM